MRPIKLTQENLDKALESFLGYIDNQRFVTGKVNFQMSFSEIMKDTGPRPSLLFTPEAYLKMTTLVKDYSTEIGWHGIVNRIPTKNIYVITDILVYPQTVAGATVTTDQVEYQNWLMGQSDEVFPRIRFQGHSHVGMPTGPSGVDINFYDGILQGLKENDFYIFAILNKRDENTYMIYDYSRNIIYDNADIDVGIITRNGKSFNTWMKEAAELVKKHEPAVTVYNFEKNKQRLNDEDRAPYYMRDKRKGKDKSEKKDEANDPALVSENLQEVNEFLLKDHFTGNVGWGHENNYREGGLD